MTTILFPLLEQMSSSPSNPGQGRRAEVIFQTHSCRTDDDPVTDEPGRTRRFLTIAQAAEELNVKQNEIRALLRTGELRGIQVGAGVSTNRDAREVLLISGSEVGQRVEQHRSVIEAAKAEGVELIAYTSIANADTTGIKLAAEHEATETLLQESGVPFVLLRNNWYLENYIALCPAHSSRVRSQAAPATVGSAQLPAQITPMQRLRCWLLRTRPAGSMTGRRRTVHHGRACG